MKINDPDDVYISCNAQDEDWVDEWLLPRLRRANLRVQLSYEQRAGVSIIENIQSAIDQSYCTVIVLTPHWIDDQWRNFDGALAASNDPAAQQGKVIPLLLHDCQIPRHLAFRQYRDFRRREKWESQCTHLIRDIKDKIPLRAPILVGKTSDWGAWREWVWRYRREIRNNSAIAIAVYLVLALILNVIPFDRRAGWISLQLNAPNATYLLRAGEVLLVGGNNTEYGCDKTQSGIWRSADDGKSWQVISVPDLCFSDSNQGRVLADIRGFASSTARPTRIYAATSNVGLLRSDQAGESKSWHLTSNAEPGNRKLLAVAVHPQNPDQVFVVLESGGLYRSDTAGASWQRLDQRKDSIICPSGKMPLLGLFSVGAITVTPRYLIAGTSDPGNLSEGVHVPAGLYASEDSGNCWRLLEAGADAYEYRKLVYLPSAEPSAGEHILGLTKNWKMEPKDKTQSVWRIDVTESSPARETLWNHIDVIGDVIAQGDTWYAVTLRGDVFRGPLTSPSEGESLPSALPCSVLACDVSLASGNRGGLPLLLVASPALDGKLFGGRVLRFDAQVDWFHSFVP